MKSMRISKRMIKWILLIIAEVLIMFGILVGHKHGMILPQWSDRHIIVFTLAFLLGLNVLIYLLDYFGRNGINKSQIIQMIIVVICLLSMVPILLISIYSRPCVDDFSNSLQVKQLIDSGNYSFFSILSEAMKTNIWYYQNWQGLYVSSFVLSLQPGVFGETFYCVGSYVLLLLSFLCVWGGIRSINRCFGEKKRLLEASVALIIFVIIWQGLPSPNQGLYWFNGAWNYMPYMFLAILNASVVVSLFCDDKIFNIGKCIGTTILSFFISGGNHVSTFFNIMVLVVLSFNLIRRKKYTSIPALIVAILGFIFVMTAPGTAVRQDEFIQPSILQTIIATFIKSLEYLSKWINLSWCVMLIIMFPLLYKFAKTEKCKTLRCNPLIMIIISYVFIAGMFAVPYYGMGTFGTERIVNIIWIAFIVLSIVNEFVIILWLNDKHKRIILEKMSDVAKSGIVLAGILLLCVLGGAKEKSTAIMALDEVVVSGVATDYAGKFDDRIITMKSQGDHEIVKVDGLPQSDLLFFSDITAFPYDWVNEYWKKYYGRMLVVWANDSYAEQQKIQMEQYNDW